MSRFGRYGHIDRNNPEAAGVCDRGGEIRKRSDLLPEMEWRGGRLVPNGFLVCRRHMDVPNPQIGGQLPLPPDPPPVKDPRPLNDPVFVYDELLVDAVGLLLTDETGNILIRAAI